MGGDKFGFVCALKAKLWFSKFIELDECGRPPFVNPVTYIQKVLPSVLPRVHNISRVSLKKERVSNFQQSH